MAGLAQEIHQAIVNAKQQPVPGSPEAEAMSTALITAAKGWKDGAYSEDPMTSRNRRRSRHEQLTATGELSVLDRYIEADDIVVSASAGLSRRQYLVWHYCDREGLTQARVAQLLGVSQQTVSRVLAKAREELKYLVDRHAKRVFSEESHRCAYFKPGYRPKLPEGVEEARERIEQPREITTHIMPDALNIVEVWRNGSRPVEYIPDGTEGGYEKPIGAKSIESLRKKAKRIRRKRIEKIKLRNFQQ